MTAKMLNRQATKAHKESEVQKAKVKKVLPTPPFPQRRGDTGTMAKVVLRVGYSTGKQRYRTDSRGKFDSQGTGTIEFIEAFVED